MPTLLSVPSYERRIPLDRLILVAISLAALMSFWPSVTARVIVATVDPNGSCYQLLLPGDAILYINGSEIRTTKDVHTFLADANPGDTVVVQTTRHVALIRLSNESTRLGIGIANVNRTIILNEETPILGPEPSNQSQQLGTTRSNWPSTAVFAGISILLVFSLMLFRGRLGHVAQRVRRLQSTLARCVMLFLVALIVRLAFTISFFAKFGSHATNVMELWFYVDVAKGHGYFLNQLDPTRYILRFFGLLSPEETPFYATVACAMIFASLVPVILYFLVRERQSELTATLAGILYAFMVQPVTLSCASFTHHIIQIPLALLFLLFLTRAIKRSGAERIAYFALTVFTGIMDFFVNYEILVYAAIGYCLVFLAVISWLLRDRGQDTDRSWAVIMISILLLASPVYFFFSDLTRIADRIAPVKPLQYPQMVHEPLITFATAMPIPGFMIMRFYGMLLLLAPFGIYCCYRYRYMLPYLLLVFGFLISLHWARGSRILDISFAILGAMSLSHWKKDWRLIALLFSGFLVVWSSSLRLGSEYSHVFFWICLAVAVGSLYVPSKRQFHPSLNLIALTLLFFLSINYIDVIQDGSPQSTQAQYRALKWLGTQAPRGSKVLTALDRGHLPSAIADLGSASDEYNFNPAVAKAFYETEETARITLSEAGVTYVMVTSTDATVIWQPEGSGSLYTRGYLNFRQNLPGSSIPYLLVVRLTYPDGKLKYFHQIHTEVDPATGETVRIYKLSEIPDLEDLQPAGHRITLSLIVRNQGPSTAKIWIPLTIVDRSQQALVIADSVVATVPPMAARAISIQYPVFPRPSLQVNCPSGEMWTSRQGETDFLFYASDGREGTGFRLSVQLASLENHQQEEADLVAHCIGSSESLIRTSLRGDLSGYVVESVALSPLSACCEISRVTVSTPPEPTFPPQLLFCQLD